jgi:hypothetical protein
VFSLIFGGLEHKWDLPSGKFSVRIVLDAMISPVILVKDAVLAFRRKN